MNNVVEQQPSLSGQSEENPYLIDLIFRPAKLGTLRFEETRLLSAYIGEILGEIEVEEKRIIAEEQKAALEITARKNKKGDGSCN